MENGNNGNNDGNNDSMGNMMNNGNMGNVSNSTEVWLTRLNSYSPSQFIIIKISTSFSTIPSSSISGGVGGHRH